MEQIELGGTPETPNVLRLFHEDIAVDERLAMFKFAADQLLADTKEIATPEVIKAINNTFDLTYVFNYHSGAADAARSVAATKDPFITFVENVNDDDHSKGLMLPHSVANAYDMYYAQSTPTKPINSANPTNQMWDFGYWRERGLLAKGSLIASVDIRRYSRRLLDAVIGFDYGPDSLGLVPVSELQAPFDELLADRISNGLLITASNAVRELTSTKQIIQTLRAITDPRHGKNEFDEVSNDKIQALQYDKMQEQGRLPAYIFYGIAHHAMIHPLRNYGIEAKRVFTSEMFEKPYVYTGHTQDQFFSSHVFGISNERAEKYARQVIIESTLWAPLNNSFETGVILGTTQYMPAFIKIAKFARDPYNVMHANDILQAYQEDPTSIVQILFDIGVPVHNLDNPSVL